MIKHIVLWKLKDSAQGRTRQENAREIKTRLEGLRGKISGMLSLEVGCDFSQEPESADLVLYTEFESKKALQAYQTHPLHEAIKPMIGGARSERRVADYEV